MPNPEETRPTDLGPIESYKSTLSALEQIRENPPHFEIATTLSNLGDAYQNIGKLEEAIECYDRSYDLLTQAVGEEDMMSKSVAAKLASAVQLLMDT